MPYLCALFVKQRCYYVNLYVHTSRTPHTLHTLRTHFHTLRTHSPHHAAQTRPRFLSAALDTAACPRRVTTVFCLVIADDPTAAQRCALNAASLALLDARAPMRAIPLAVSVDCGGCAVDVVLDAARDDAAVLALESRGAPVKASDMLEAVRRAGEDVKALRARVLAGGR